MAQGEEIMYCLAGVSAGRLFHNAEGLPTGKSALLRSARGDKENQCSILYDCTQPTYFVEPTGP